MSTLTSTNLRASSPRGHISWPLLLILLALTVCTTACKDKPTKAWALEMYPKHKDTFMKVRKDLQPLLVAFAPEPVKGGDPDAIKKQQDAQQARKLVFEEKALAVLKSHPEIIGWEITYAFPKAEKPVIQYSFEKLAAFRPSYQGAITFRAGKRDAKGDDKYPLGWGKYQLPNKRSKKSLGMDVALFFKGIEIYSKLNHNKAELTLKLFFVDPATHKDAE